MDKLKRLEELLQVANKDYASTQEVAEITAAILKEINTIKKTINSQSSDFNTELGKLLNNHKSLLKSSDYSVNYLSKEIQSLKSSLSNLKLQHGRDGLNGKNAEPVDVKAIIDEIKSGIPTIEDIGDSIPMLGEPIRDALELLEGDERIDASAIKGLEKTKGVTQETLDRAVSILDQRTSFLINKVNNLPKSTGGVSGGQVNTVVAGTGISVDSTDPVNPVVTNSSPDQTVAIIAGTNITSVTGTYPNFTINADTQAGTYTDEKAQDAVGNAIGNGLDYDDSTGAISVDETELSLPFLKLDQTTPQSVINGAPLFNVGLKSPKIYPAADSTTAIQLNKADGTTNVLNVDTTNGRIGIGTDAPAYTLDVVGQITSKGLIASTPTMRVLGTDTASFGLFQVGLNVTDGGSVGSRIVMNDAGTGGKRWDISSGATVAGGLTFRNNTDSLNAVTILSDGKVGINTIAPLAKLHINDGATIPVQDASTNLIVADSGSSLISIQSGVTSVSGITFGDNDSQVQGYLRYNNTDSSMRFYTTGTEKVVIDTSGNVGIGTIAPTAVLHLKAETTSASTGSLKLAAGTLMTVPEAGVISYDGTAWYLTI